MLADAQVLRARMGDEAVFRGLNEAPGSAPGDAGGWGRIAQAWSAPRFEAALQAPSGGKERFQLVGALARAFFSTVRHLSASEQELYTSLDEGLAAMAHHARDLGYDGVILFLDEFILWLASRSADAAWIAREGQKVAKLAESGNADRPVPIIGFMTRQRDLREPGRSGKSVALLAKARSCDRPVIFTGDHGYLLDQDTKLRGSSPNARWREPDLEPYPGELRLSGARIEAASGLDEVVLAWAIAMASRRAAAGAFARRPLPRGGARDFRGPARGFDTPGQGLAAPRFYSFFTFSYNFTQRF